MTRIVFGGLAGELSYDDAFTDEAEREVLALFDADLGLDTEQ